MSLLVFSNDNSSSVTSTPVEDLFHVELAAVESDQDPIEDFYEPKRTNALRKLKVCLLYTSDAADE